MRAFALSLLVVPALASAVPAQLTHTGRLVDSGGAPLTGVQSLTVSLYADATGGTPLWTDTFSANVDEGYFAVQLGSGAPLDAAVLDQPAVFVGIAVGTSPELAPRLPVNSVPYALRAGSVAGGDVDATSVTVNGQTVIDTDGTIDYGRITGAPADADTLASLGCDAGEVAIWGGSAWDCGPAGASTFDASAITSGTVAYQRLPVGSSADTIAAGDHTHSFSTITGQAAFSQLPVGTAADTVAAGNHTHSAAAITSGVLDPARLPPSFQVGANTAACSSGIAGTIRYNAGQLELCNGTAWTPAGIRPGENAAAAALSCKAILDADPTARSGYYFLKPGSGPAFPAYCDMDTEGGGWTLCMAYDNATYDAANWPNVGAVRNKVLAKTWGETRLAGAGSQKGNFCNQLAVNPSSTQLRAEVATVLDNRTVYSALFRVQEADFFTQTHDAVSRDFDCLVDSTGTKRLMYANYTSPARTYNEWMLGACSGSNNAHRNLAVTNAAGGFGVDGALVMSNIASGSGENTELSMHFNWYGDAAAESLYVTTTSYSNSKFGTSATWNTNVNGRNGASPGPYFCYTYCGYTNVTQNVFKQRLWLR